MTGTIYLRRPKIDATIDDETRTQVSRLKLFVCAEWMIGVGIT